MECFTYRLAIERLFGLEPLFHAGFIKNVKKKLSVCSFVSELNLLTVKYKKHPLFSCCIREENFVFAEGKQKQKAGKCKLTILGLTDIGCSLFDVDLTRKYSTYTAHKCTIKELACTCYKKSANFQLDYVCFLYNPLFQSRRLLLVPFFRLALKPGKKLEIQMNWISHEMIGQTGY